MVGVFDRNAHLLKRQNRVAAQIRSRVIGGQVEKARIIDGVGLRGILEVEVLELGANVHGIAHARGLGKHATQHVARVAIEGLALGRENVAEHACHAIVLGAPRQHLERARVGKGNHVGLCGTREALD